MVYLYLTMNQQKIINESISKVKSYCKHQFPLGPVIKLFRHICLDIYVLTYMSSAVYDTCTELETYVIYLLCVVQVPIVDSIRGPSNDDIIDEVECAFCSSKRHQVHCQLQSLKSNCPACHQLTKKGTGPQWCNCKEGKYHVRFFKNEKKILSFRYFSPEGDSEPEHHSADLILLMRPVRITQAIIQQHQS